MALSAGQFLALSNLSRKQAGEDVDWINISDARALTELGLAKRTPSGWVITPEGTALIQGQPAPGGLKMVEEPTRPFPDLKSV